MVGGRRTLAALVGAVLIVSLAPSGLLAPVSAGGACEGKLPPAEPDKKPGRRLRFGINPAGKAGQLGPEADAARGVPRKTLRALERLRPSGSPFVVRLNRFFWSLGRKGIKLFARKARHYSRHGYKVELQLRYHPRPEQEGRIRKFTRWVRRVVRRFGKIPRVVSLQVTNEVNLTASPDSSDGAYARARDALIRGVIAAKKAVRRQGYRRMKVGFNWFYRTDDANERSFWEYLRDKGGPRFVRAVDWVGLDAYPGTYVPPVVSPGGERGALINALSILRKCYLPIPGIKKKVPIKVEENGYPTGEGRSYERQAEAMRTMVDTIHDFRGTYHVTDYRWFDLRDADTEAPNFQQHYGILEDDYTRKPAFGVYRRLVRKLTR